MLLPKAAEGVPGSMTISAAGYKPAKEDPPADAKLGLRECCPFWAGTDVSLASQGMEDSCRRCFLARREEAFCGNFFFSAREVTCSFSAMSGEGEGEGEGEGGKG